MQPEISEREATQVKAFGYHIGLGAFFASLMLFFITLVDVRRAFLLPAEDYLRIGSPSPIFNVVPLHLPLLLAGLLGAWLSYRYMAGAEKGLADGKFDLSARARYLAVAMALFFIADLVALYRGVPAARIVEAGRMGVGQAIPLSAFPWWLRPLGEGVNYLALVWHATLLAILIGALSLPLVGAFFRPLVRERGFKSHLAGAALAIPHPFCSCCSAPIGNMLFRGGASLGPTLSFVVASPMLNVTALILAASLLPTRFALLRVVGGIIVAVFVTYAVSLAASRWWEVRRTGEGGAKRMVGFYWRALNWYSGLFRLEKFLQEKSIDSPANFISNWVRISSRLASLVIPILLVGGVVTAAVVGAFPSPKNDFIGVIVAAAFGTMLMIPTWTEIPVAVGLINAGLTGPAAALLLTLPAVSIPCLVLVAGGIGKWKVAVLLGLSVFFMGSVSGLVFM